MRLWVPDDGKPLGDLKGQHKYVTCLCYFPVGNILASGDYGSIRLWDVSNRKTISVLKGEAGVIYSVAVAPDSKVIASSANDSHIRLWDVNSAKEVIVKKVKRSSDSVKFSPEGTKVVVATGTIFGLWNAQTFQEEQVFKKHNSTIQSLDFSADGKLVASGSHDASIKLWSVDTGKELRQLKGHKVRVWAVTFSSDGKYVASAGWDGTVKLWNVQTGANVETLSVRGKSVLSVAVSPDLQFLAAGTDQRELHIWRLT